MIGIVYEFVISIVIWFIIGYLFACHYHNNILIVIGVVIGIFIGFLRFINMIKNRNKIKNKKIK